MIDSAKIKFVLLSIVLCMLLLPVVLRSEGMSDLISISDNCLNKSKSTFPNEIRSETHSLTPDLATCTTTTNSSDIPVAISTVNVVTVFSDLIISESGSITDINLVNLNISHTWINDLIISLISPNGTEIILINNICGAQDDIIGGIDDEASSNPSCPPTSGVSFLPFSALSGFDGLEMNGTWQLKIQDTYGDDGGSLNSWGLEIEYNCTPAIEICNNSIDDDADGFIDDEDPDCPCSGTEGYAIGQTNNGVLDPNNALGTVDEAFADLRSGDDMILDFGSVIPFGSTVTLYMTRGTYAGTIDIDASLNSGSGYSGLIIWGNPNNASTTVPASEIILIYEAVDFTVPIGGMRYMRFDRRLGQIRVDAVRYCIPSIEVCNDNVDNDGDGATDSDDPDCDDCTSTVLTNRDFQNDLTSWVDWGGNSIITEANGNKYARTTTSTGGGYGQNVPCIGGSTVTVSFYGRKNASEYAGAGFHGFNASGTKVFNDLTAAITGTDWDYYTVSSVVPNDVVDVSAFLWKSGGAGYVDIDGFCMTIVPPTISCTITPGTIDDPVVACPSNDPGIINSLSAASVSGSSTSCNEIVNDEFDSGTSNWSLYASNGAVATWSVDNTSELSGANSAYVDITTITGTGWHIEIEQGSITTSTAQTYDISFEAKADAPRTLYVSVQLREAPWNEYWSTTVNLTTTAQTFTFDNVAIPINSSIMGLMFKPGVSATNFHLDNVYFSEGDCNTTINYKWQKREYNGSSWGAWADIASATNETYNPPAIAANTEYRRLAQVDGCATWEESNAVAADICLEICDDNVDNDGDGDIDCDDADCGQPSITSVSSTNPNSCPNLNNGTISIVASGSNLSYSINGGSSYFATPNFAGLTPGIYNVRVRNSATDCSVLHASNVVLTNTNCPLSCVNSYPYSESFETDLGAWQQWKGDDSDWTRRTASTPSGSTGPTAASDGSYYIFTEASNTFNSDMILRGCFDLDDQCNSTLDFDYHMWGSSMGSLTIDVSTDNESTWTTLLTISGDQGNQWNSQSIDLSAYDGQEIIVRITGLTGSSFTSDIALDNMSITTSSCTEICDDNIDNDGDGDVDCDDADCGAPSITSVNAQNPSNCPILNDGSITITASGSNLEYSINDGSSYQSSNTFIGLSNGNYDVRIRNNATGCTDTYAANSILLTDPICIESNCNDGIDNDGDGLVDCLDGDCPFGITASTDQTICGNENITISGFGADHYYWNTGAATQAITVSPSATSTYTVTGYQEAQTIADIITASNFDTNNFSYINCTWGASWGTDGSLFDNLDTGDGFHAFVTNNSLDWGIAYDLGDTYHINNLGLDRRDTWPGRGMGGVFQVFNNGSLVYQSSILTGPGIDEIYASPAPDVVGDEIRYIFLNGAQTESSDHVLNFTEWIFGGSSVCSDSEDIVITVNSSPTLTNVTAISPTNCPTLNNGNITIAASGSNLEYSIDNGSTYQASNSFTALSDGTYDIIVRNSVTLCIDTNAANSVILIDPSCVEICNDNIDNDGDGDVDCDDADCGQPSITSAEKTHLSNCPTLDNGTITITALGSNLEYSIDNGNTFQAANNFTGLDAGSYYVVVRNSVSLCSITFVDNPLVVSTKVCVEICDNNIDDDGDGNIDCADDDCVPTVTLSADDTSICPDQTIIINSTVCENYQDFSENRPLGNNSWQNSTSDVGGSGIAGDGELCFAWADHSGSTIQAIGLNSDPFTNQSVSTIDYAFYIVRRADNNLFQVIIRENNVNKFTAYSSSTSIVGEPLCIRRTGSTIEYYKDGVLLYTSLVSSAGTLYYDNSFYSNPAHSIYGEGYSHFTDISLCATPDVDYNWSTSATIDSVIVTAADTYTLTVTDSYGCTSSSSLTISTDVICDEVCDDGIDNDGDGDVDCDDSDCGIPSITSVTPTDADNCPSLDNGTINIVASGSNLEYSIDDGVSFVSTTSFTGLSGGTYSIRVRNSVTQCYASFSTTITETVCIEICDDNIDNDGDGDIDCDDSYCSPTITGISYGHADNCPSLDAGSISIIATGSNLEYSITNGTTFQSSPNFTGLTAGSYIVVVRNSVSSCITTFDSNPVTINSPACVEICDNGIDDDGDNLIDCADPDCQPSITITADDIDLCPGESTILYTEVCEKYDAISAQRPLTTQGWANSLDQGGSGITGDGELCFTLSDFNLSSLQTLGLDANPNLDDHYNSIDFGINLAIRPDINKFVLHIRESGTLANVAYDSATSYVGANICIRRTGTTIEYLLNGTVLYTSALSSTGTLYYDNSIYSSSSIAYYIDGYSLINNISLCGSVDASYSWNGGSTNPDLNVNTPGTYTVQVTDTHGCTATDNITINLDNCPEICDDGIDNDNDGDIDCDDTDCGQPSLTSLTPVDPNNCQSLDNGSITIVASGSNLAYSIDGGTTYQASGTFSNLTYGNYNIVIENTATGCNLIYAANPITLAQISCPEICNDGIDNDLDGDIDCEDDDCGAPTFNLVNTDNITDCINLDNGQIAIAANTNTGTGGSVEFSIDGGLTWSSTSIFSNLIPGAYNARIRYLGFDCYLDYPNNPIVLIAQNCPEICNDGVDNDGDGDIDCNDNDCIPIIEAVTVKNANNCPSLNNGFIHINPLENTNYEYSIDGGTFYQNNQNFNGLAAGTYNVSIRRIGTNCYSVYAANPIIIINENCAEDCSDGVDNDGDGLIDCDDPDCMSAVINNVATNGPSNCPVLDDGNITINSTGSDLIYSIDDGANFQLSNSFTSLMNGNYNVVIKDTISGCELEYAANPIMLIDSACPEICNDGIDNDGDGDIDCADGECGTPIITSVSVSNPDNCPTLNNGLISVDALGINLEYSINGGSTYQSSNLFPNLGDGTYTIRVRNGTTGCYIDYANNNVVLIDPICVEICGDGIDNDGDGNADCADTDCPTPNIIQVNSDTPDNCPDLDNGYINIFASGDDKEFSIDGGNSYQASNQFNNLSADDYNVRVRNTVSGCFVDYAITISITNPVCVEICGDGIDNDGDGNADCDDPDCAAPSYNNVSTTSANNCPSLDNGTIVISASGANLQYSINGGISFQTSNTFTGLVAFGYTVVIKNSITGCEVDYPFNPLVVVEEVCAEICDDGIDNDGDGLIDCDDPECNPATIDNVTYSAPNNCPTLDNGAITILATGSDLEYSITNGIIYQNSPTFTGLYNGAFNIKVRNKINGCILTYANNPLVLTDPECGEICDDGIDNDGDGIIDCADGDCGSPQSVGEDHTDPDNCYALNNGNILMDAVGTDVQWSIDGGTTFQDDPSFDNLVAGTYYLVARNSATGCETNGPTVTLYNSTCNEICDDNVDNDGDGDIDCDDSNCGAPTIGLVTAYSPYNCPVLDNGSISITGSGNDLQFSLDGGTTYQSSNTFAGLSPGNYYVALINTSTGCITPYPNNPVVLEDPICGEICGDGIDNDGDGDIDCEDSECTNASNTFMIDFDIDTPVITKYSNTVAIAEGNVLYAADGTDAGFNYIVSMVIDGGPAGGSPVSFPSGSVLNDAEFNTNDPSIVYNGAMTAIDLDLQGQENINGTINYYRDNTSNMTVTMYLDNGQAFSDIQYTIVDIDMDLTGSNGSYNGAYIDQVQILSGAGTNTITPYNSNFVKVTGDVARANFTDNNNNNLPDQHEFIQAQTFNPAGNITVNTPGTISSVQFVYTDYGLNIEGYGGTYHRFNSGNQRIGLGKYLTFESGCQVIEICDDGIDNDGDGLIDCADDDCNPVITFLSATETDNCPLLDNGTITIQAIGENLEYSIDGGITYQSSNVFTNLSGGTYNVWVQNSVTGCNIDYAFNPVVITDPICIEICDDGIDNDGNGLTDCEDPACGVGEITNIVLVDPTNCPESDNGSITISATGSNLEYSIDGGVSYHASNVFNNLVARNYTVIIRNTNTGCIAGYPTNPVSLSPTNCNCVGVDNSFRANFENTIGDNAWTITYGASDGNFLIGSPNPYNEPATGTVMEIVAYRGNQSLLTGNGYQQDLDSGEAIATSKTIELSSNVTDIDLNLQYYFSHANNSSSADYLYIEIIDAVTSSVLNTIITEIGSPTNKPALWTTATADLTSLAGSSVRIRVRSSDYGGGSKLEVALDDIEIIETPDVTLDLPFSAICTEDVSFVLSGGLPLGGTYSGTGIVDGTTFNTSIAGTGSHTITYTYTTNDGCEVTATDVVVVDEVNVTGSDTPEEICIGESVLIEAPTSSGAAPFTYAWSNGLGTATSHTVSPISNTQYQVTVTDDNGCTAATFINVIVNQPPTANLSIDGSECFEAGITQLNLSVSGGSPNYTYAYSNPYGFTSTEQNPVVPSRGIYNVTVTDSNGCTATDTVEVLDSFTPSVSGDDDICSGTSAILTASPSGLNYEWDAFAGGATTHQVSVSPISTTTYVVTVTNDDGCTATADILVTVSNAPEVQLTADNNTTCSGETVNITSTLTNNNASLTYFYAWSNSANTSSISVNPTANTTYSLTITDSNMCQVVETIDITVNEAEIQNVTLGSNVACDGSCTGDMIIDVDYAVTGPFIIYYDYGGTTFSSGPYNFGSEPDTAIVIGGLCAGSYTNISIQGTNTGCTDTWTGDDIEISESHADWEHVTLTSILSNCNGICDGSFTVDANLGVTGEFNISYSYNGNTITDGPHNFAGDILIDGLCEGTYSDIMITSIESGCQDIWPTDIEITTPDPEATIVANINDDCQIGEGSVTINVSGGQIPYTIYWKSEDGSTTGSQVFNFHGNHTIYGLTGHINYCFEIEDSNGCSTDN